VAALVIEAVPSAAQETTAGAMIFAERCAVCHQPNGQGVPGVYPPINETLGHFLATASGRNYLGDVVDFGLAGSITAGGQRYIGQMKLTPPLSDQEVADVLNYVLTTFNSESLPADARLFEAGDISALRARPRTPTSVAKARQDVVAELERLGLKR
jgi:mono/diheme cytochrome c family protein